MHVHVLLPLSHVFVYISLEVYTLTKLYMFIKYFKSSKTTKYFFAYRMMLMAGNILVCIVFFMIVHHFGITIIVSHFQCKRNLISELNFIYCAHKSIFLLH